jgi:hypothetical protein
MRALLTLLAAVSITSPAAANWVFVADCGEQNQVRSYFYDSGTVRTDDGRLVVHLRGDYSRYAGSRAAEGRLVWAVDCSNRTFVELSRTEQTADGRVIETFPEPTGIMPIIGGSIAAKLAAKICV